MVYKKKKQKFAILVDEYGRNKPQLRELINLLKDDYPFLKQAANVVTRKRITTAKKGDYIVFGSSNKYDFRVMNGDHFEEWAENRRLNEAELYEDWDDVLDLLQQYAEANYSDQFEEEDEYYYRPYGRRKQQSIYIEDFNPNDIYYVHVNIPKTHKSPAKKQKTSNKINTSVLDKASVHHYFVKVGYDTYSIQLNDQDDEFVKIDGNIYWIDRDSNGYGKLSIQ